MAITLTNSPPLYAFSGDEIRALFTLSDIYIEQGEYATNEIEIPQNVTVGTQYTLNYRGQQIIMTSATVPDDSGNQFAGSISGELNIPIDYQLPYFQSNYLLSNDFFVTADDGKIILTARKKGQSYNIPGFNTVPGLTEKVKPNLSVKFILWLENIENNGFENVYESQLTVVNSETATAEAIINDKLHNWITADLRNNMLDIPETEPVICKKSCRRYYFQFAEVYGDQPQIRRLFKSDNFTVLHGGMSSVGEATKNLQEILAPGTADKDNFLKQGFKSSVTRVDQPQYLYFFNTRADKPVRLNVKYYFIDGTVATTEVGNIEIPSLRKAGFNIQFDKFYVSDDYPLKKVKKFEMFLVDSVGARISASWFYELDYEFREYHRYFLNWSSWGTLDSRMMYGKGSIQFDLVQSEAEKGKHRSSELEKGSSLVFNKSITSKFSVTTGFLEDKSQILFNRDLFLSAFIYVLKSGSRLPIKITSKTIEEYPDGGNLFAQRFEYEYLFSDMAYTEGDEYVPVTPPAPLPGLIHFGPAIAVPATEADVLALPNTLAPEVYGFPLYTGINRIFVIAPPPGKALGNVFNQTSQEDLTTEFHKVNIMVNGLNYPVYTMQMAIPYSIDNTLIISIINV